MALRQLRLVGDWHVMGHDAAKHLVEELECCGSPQQDTRGVRARSPEGTNV